VTFEGDRLEAIVGEMRAFLAAIERPTRPGGLEGPAANGAYTGAALPPCPVHLVEMRYTPAGTNARTRQHFSASYRCPRPGCREASWLE
jgi:hypothetical protein